MAEDPFWTSRRPLALVLLAGALTYLSALPGALFWDSEALILNNIFLRSFRYLPRIWTTSVTAGAGEVSNYYRPVLITWLLAQYQLWGAAPLGYHAVNVACHLANAALLFAWARRLFRDDKTAFWAALLFTLHPIQTETVNYADHIAGMLAFLFGMSTLLLRDSGRRTFSLAAWTLALLSKEEGVVFLPILALHELLGPAENRAARLRALWPHAAILAVYLALHLTAFNFLRLPLLHFGAQRGAYAGLSLRLLTFAKALLVYFRLLAVPTGLHFDRGMAPASSPFDCAAWGAACADVLILGLLWRRGKSAPGARLGLAWFCAALLPYCGIVPFNNILAEHFLYIPAAGLSLTAAALLPKPPPAVLLALLFGFYCAQDARRSRQWQEPALIYRTTLAGNPKSYRAANNLGVEYYRRRRLEDARNAFTRALTAKADYAPSLNNVGAVEESQGKPQQALAWYQKSAQADPSYVLAHKNRANILLGLGRYAEAEQAALDALAYYPQYADALEILGMARFKQGKKKEALSAFELLEKIAPSPQTEHNLALVRAALRQKG